jgi:hypothetical protein
VVWAGLMPLGQAGEREGGSERPKRGVGAARSGRADGGGGDVKVIL